MQNLKETTGYACDKDAMAAMALLLRIYARKGYAASLRQRRAAWVLWELGLCKWSDDGWRLEITDFGREVAALMDWRRHDMLDKRCDVHYAAYRQAPACSDAEDLAWQRYAAAHRGLSKIDARADYYLDGP